MVLFLGCKGEIFLNLETRRLFAELQTFHSDHSGFKVYFLGKLNNKQIGQYGQIMHLCKKILH